MRVTVDLADANPSSDPLKYDRVGSWKWLRLPLGTSTKRRTRKQGKIGMFLSQGSMFPMACLISIFSADAEPQDTLNLITEVVCASAPSIAVVSCSSCRVREVRRCRPSLPSLILNEYIGKARCEKNRS